ncbi:MAG: alpha/beta hydrolase [Candidatus Nitrosotenuis sp.]|nr:MAG: alpha/beta hydrolase [Candidatus Nitrosotenuis sp.]
MTHSFPKTEINTVFGKIGDHNIRYLESGNSDRVIVLLHGLGASAERWLHILPYLTERYRVIAPDIIGFGLSDKPTVDYTIEFFTEFLDEFINHISAKNPISIIGSSLGGRISIEYVIQNAHNIEKMILVAPAGINEEPTEALHSYIQAALHPTIEDAKKAFLMMAGNNRVVEQDVISDFVNRMLLPNSRLSFMSSLLGLKKSTLTKERLGKILIPTLIIWGKDDRVIPIKNATRFYTSIKNSKHLEMKKCGHVPFVDEPELFSKLVLQFLSEK